MAPDPEQAANPTTDAAAASSPPPGEAPSVFTVLLEKLDEFGDRLAALEGGKAAPDATLEPAAAPAADIATEAAPARPPVGTPELEKGIDSILELGDNELDLVHEAIERELYKRRSASA